MCNHVCIFIWSLQYIVDFPWSYAQRMRQGLVSTGMGDLKTKMLTVAEAKKRKADADTQRKTQQKLLQAKQPTAIECAA